MLVYAIIFITLALAFYTVGVWSEKLQGTLKKWHLCLFWIGFVFDTLGTTLMGQLANDAFRSNFHSITGITAIVLMLVHALWATIVLIKDDQKQKVSFHKFSILVWILWLIPFVSGMILGMTK